MLNESGSSATRATILSSAHADVSDTAQAQRNAFSEADDSFQMSSVHFLRQRGNDRRDAFPCCDGSRVPVLALLSAIRGASRRQAARAGMKCA